MSGAEHLDINHTSASDTMPKALTSPTSPQITPNIVDLISKQNPSSKTQSVSSHFQPSPGNFKFNFA